MIKLDGMTHVELRELLKNIQCRLNETWCEDEKRLTKVKDQLENEFLNDIENMDVTIDSFMDRKYTTTCNFKAGFEIFFEKNKMKVMTFPELCEDEPKNDIVKDERELSEELDTFINKIRPRVQELANENDVEAEKVLEYLCERLERASW